MSSDLIENSDVSLDTLSNKQLSGVQRLLEAGLLFFTVFAMFMMVALFSFDPADPGWAQTGYQTEVRNLGGAVGAYLSDLFLNLFGLIAYSLPFVIAVVGWLLFQRFHELMKLDYLTLGLKLIGFFMFYLGVSSLASMNFDDVFYFSAGGILGDVLSKTLLPYFSFVGSTLLFLLFTCAGFVLLTGFSWLKFIDYVGKQAITSILWLADAPKFIQTHFGTGTSSQSSSFKDVLGSVKNRLLEHKAKVITAEPAVLANTAIIKTAEPFAEELAPKSNAAAAKSEPFIDISELMSEPTMGNVQAHVSEKEITAAFAEVEQPDVADDIQTPIVTPMPVAKPLAPVVQNLSADNGQVNLVAVAEDNFKGMPSIDLLDRPDKAKNPINQAELDQVSRLVEAKLLDFGVQAQVVSVYPGPVITRFELDLAPGVKVNKITSLSKDLARALSAISVRVVEVIPGKSVIGLELPNKHREIVYLSEVIACPAFEESSSPLAMVLGKDIA